ncbi:MAG: DUF6206 family protein [Candidatus Diapherotrites archaeon]
MVHKKAPMPSSHPEPPERKLFRLEGKGVHSKPNLVEGGAFSGKVLKGAGRQFSRKEVFSTKRACELYQKALIDAGIPILPAKVKVAGSGNRWRLYFIQDYVPQNQILSNVFAGARPEKCLRLTSELLSNAKKAFDSRKKSNVLFGMDVNFHNWVLSGNQLVFLDFYVPPIKEKGSFDRALFTGVDSRLVKAGLLALYPRQQRRRYDPKRIVLAVLGTAIQYRPELEREILELGRRFVAENFSGRERAFLFGRMKSAQALVQPTLLGKAAMALERRKKRKIASQKQAN